MGHFGTIDLPVSGGKNGRLTITYRVPDARWEVFPVFGIYSSSWPVRSSNQRSFARCCGGSVRSISLVVHSFRLDQLLQIHQGFWHSLLSPVPEGVETREIVDLFAFPFRVPEPNTGFV